MFSRRFSFRNANRGWFVGLRPDGQSRFLEPIGKWLHQLGPNVAAAAKKAVRHYQDMRLEDFEAVKPFDNREPAAQTAAIQSSVDISPELEVNTRNSVVDLFGSPDDLPPGLYWRGSDGIEEISPIEEATGETAADENSVSGVGVGPMTHDPSLIIGEESPDKENTTSSPQFSSSGSKKMSPPLSQTMVESLLTTAPDGADTIEYLSEALADIFVKKEVADPRVQALLRGLEHVDCQKLADELREFADSIGANSTGK